MNLFSYRAGGETVADVCKVNHWKIHGFAVIINKKPVLKNEGEEWKREEKEKKKNRKEKGEKQKGKLCKRSS